MMVRGPDEVVLTIDVTVKKINIDKVKAIVADEILPYAEHVSIVTYANEREATSRGG